MDSLLDRQDPSFDDTDPFLHVYRHAITLHPSPHLLSRYKTKASQTVSTTSNNTLTKQTSLPRSLKLNDLLKQTPRQTHGHDEDNTTEFRALLPRDGTSNIPAKIPSRTETTPQTQGTVTVTMYASNHRPYEVPIKFFRQQTTKQSRLEQIFAGQMQGGPELLSWLDITRPKLFAQIPGFVFPPGDFFLSPKETVNFIGGLTDQRDDDVQRLGQLTAKFLREYFANMSIDDRPALYSQAAQEATDDHHQDKISAFHKETLHDIFFSIQVHRRKQNKNIVGDPLKGPHPLMARAAKEKYIQGASFHIHPAVMKKVIQHAVEARRAFLLLKNQKNQPQPSSTNNSFGSVRLLHKVKICGSSILKSGDINHMTNNNSNNCVILPIVPIPSTENWGRRDPNAWLEGWDLEVESLAHLHRNRGEFGCLGKNQERQLVYYQFARSVDEWIWRLGQAEKKNVNGRLLSVAGPERVGMSLLGACEGTKQTEEEEEELLIEL